MAKMTIDEVTNDVLQRVLSETTGDDSESCGVRLDCRVALAGDPSWSTITLARNARQRVCDYLNTVSQLN